MNLKEYISSGILESYLVGDLSPEEAKQVETMAAQHSEVKNELDRIELALEQYAVMHGALPPAGTLSSIHSKIANSNIPPRTSGPSRKLLISMAVLAFVGCGLAAWSYFNYNQSKQALAKTQEELIALKIDCEAQGEQVERQKELIDLLLNPAIQSVKMQGTALAPQAIAQVFINQNTQEVFLDTGNLPAPASDKSYQLWALIDGQPIDMGIFDPKVDNSTLQSVPFIEGAQTYAVTLEEKGGRPTPNLEQLYVIGNVS